MVEIRQADVADDPRWDEFVLSHPLGSPFHLSAWRRSIVRTFGYQPRCLMAVEGSAVRGVLPLFHCRNFLFGDVLLSSPFAVYGGSLSNSPEVGAALVREAEELGRGLGVRYVELRNAWPEQCVDLPRISRYVTFTQRIDKDEAGLLEALPRKTRYMVRKALRSPFSTRVTTDPSAFFELYARNLRRLGTPCFPRRHFEVLQEEFGEALEIREILLDNRVVAAVMSFFHRNQVLPYYGASDPAYNRYAPNNFMYFDLMRSAGRKGCTQFDFGRSKKGSGSWSFKAHWGMQMRELPYEVALVRRKTLPNYSPANPRFRVAIRLWQHLPLPVTKWIGPWFLRLVP